MAHTNATANYELSQFLGTDKPAWLVDYNGDMLKIDTALKNNADAASTNAGDIQTLQESIGAEGLTGRITAIENDIGDIKTEIGVVTLPTTAQSLTGAIAELKGVNDDQNTAIGLNTTNIAQVGGAVEGVSQLAYTIADVYDSAETYAVGDYSIYQNTLYKCTTAINVGETFDPTKWRSVKVMSEVGQGGGGSTSADDVSYDNTSSGLSATNVQDAIDEVEELIPSIVSNTEAQHGTLTAGQTSVTLTFYDQTIGINTFVDWYVSDSTVNPTAIATTSTTITFTFEAQAADLGVGAKIQN